MLGYWTKAFLDLQHECMWWQVAVWVLNHMRQQDPARSEKLFAQPSDTPVHPLCIIQMFTVLLSFVLHVCWIMMTCPGGLHLGDWRSAAMQICGLNGLKYATSALEVCRPLLSGNCDEVFDNVQNESEPHLSLLVAPGAKWPKVSVCHRLQAWLHSP